MTIWQFSDDVIVIVTNILHHNHHLCHRWSPNVEVASLLSSALPQNATDFNATVAAYHKTAQWVFQPKTSFHTGGSFVSTLPLLGGHCQWRLLVGADQLCQPACPQGSSFYNNPDELLDKDGWEYENFLIETDCRDWGASAEVQRACHRHNEVFCDVFFYNNLNFKTLGRGVLSVARRVGQRHKRCF